MKNIVFYDAKSPQSYTYRSVGISSNGVGGSEVTLATIARELARLFQVSVVQACADVSIVEDGVEWLTEKDGQEALRSADVIIIQRKVNRAYKFRIFNRKAKIIFWYHDWYRTTHPHIVSRIKHGFFLPTMRVIVQAFTSATFVTVSDCHMKNVQEYMRQSPVARLLASRIVGRRIYNPISNQFLAKRPAANIDMDKLVYISAPWKGLNKVFETFCKLKETIPTLRLHVCSPSYDAARFDISEGVTWEGSLSHEALMPLVESALCVFYPADIVPETFGLVFVESHALATPVLAHRFGAACEILGENELIDANDLDGIRIKIEQWRNGMRPVVKLDDAFLLQNVMKDWIELIDK